MDLSDTSLQVDGPPMYFTLYVIYKAIWSQYLQPENRDGFGVGDEVTWPRGSSAQVSIYTIKDVKLPPFRQLFD
jgi:hypothetical protein